jgi:hypothetical protein
MVGRVNQLIYLFFFILRDGFFSLSYPTYELFSLNFLKMHYKFYKSLQALKHKKKIYTNFLEIV